MCVCVCVCVCSLVLAYTVCVRACLFAKVCVRPRGMLECSRVLVFVCRGATESEVRLTFFFFRAGNFFLFFFFFTTLANDTQRISLEATNVPVSKLTRSATHVSNNQATFQPLDSGDPSTLRSLSLSSLSSPSLLLLLLSAACSSERSEQLTKTLYHKTLQFHSRHSIKVR